MTAHQINRLMEKAGKDHSVRKDHIKIVSIHRYEKPVHDYKLGRIYCGEVVLDVSSWRWEGKLAVYGFNDHGRLWLVDHKKMGAR